MHKFLGILIYFFLAICTKSCYNENGESQNLTACAALQPSAAQSMYKEEKPSPGSGCGRVGDLP